MKTSGEQLEKEFKQRIIEFFNLRLEKKEPSELKKFTFWLEAKCLDAKWLLQSYANILDVLSGSKEDITTHTEIGVLQGMVGKHTALVIECFVKLTDLTVKNKDTIYIQTDKAKAILKTGLGSDDETVRSRAEQAQENLLRCGYSSLLDEED